MSATLAMGLLFLLANAQSAPDNPHARDCKATDVVGTYPILPPIIEFDAGIPRRVIVEGRVNADGSLEQVAIGKSSQELGYDRAALEHARKSRLSGDCLLLGKGRVYLEYFFAAPRAKGTVERVWRESSAP